MAPEQHATTAANTAAAIGVSKQAKHRVDMALVLSLHWMMRNRAPHHNGRATLFRAGMSDFGLRPLALVAAIRARCRLTNQEPPRFATIAAKGGQASG